IRFDQRLPKSMLTDAKRLQQIIKNLLSNAFKFTHQGQVTLTIDPVQAGWSSDNEELSRASEVLAFAVTDTGIGIPTDKQQIIFEAFQQADASTSRKYGGTGLGLAISRELANLLGGEIQLRSSPNVGSTFTLFLPLVYSSVRTARRLPGVNETARFDLSASGIKRAPQPQPRVEDAAVVSEESTGPVNEASDDRDSVAQGDLVLLIVENDLAFARFLLDAARAKGFKGLVTSRGAAALTLANQYKPSAITLDMYLPDMDGWRVLDRVKQEPGARHIPVCVISTDDCRERAFKSGAMAFIEKPIRSNEVLDEMLDRLRSYVRRPQRDVLVALKDVNARRELVAQIEEEQINAVVVRSAEKFLQALEEDQFDCVVIEDGFGNLDPHDCKRALAGQSTVGPLPLLVYRGASAHEGRPAWNSDQSVTVQEARTVPKLFDRTLMALHHNLARLPEAKRAMLDEILQASKPLTGKRVLIVDDDMRNIFALATVLEEHGMDIVWSDNGRDAISRVAADPQIKVVLMDIMMPEMDGMATMKEIRKLPQGKNLPMVAVTAKAMKGDREKCIEAGAWDYLSKPVNTQDLLSVLRAWLHQ
ncbi:MAG: response regulator, partial [Pseudomonadota bacterium]|nr:response regulator [Pseudomonadota bacterium]